MIIKKNKKQSQGIVQEAGAESFEQVEEQEVKPDEIDLFDLDNIDFKQRNERRKGDRRRGFRRIDDRNLISRAREEADAIRENAAKDGYQAGLDMAKEDLLMLKDGIETFFGARQQIYDAIAPDILEISLDIAKKIIKKEMETDPQVIINTIIDVLKSVSKSEPKVTIRVNPKSVDFVKDILPNITYEYGIETKINVNSDPSIEDGGCIFQTNNGIVDASIDTQLEIIKKALEVQ